MSPLVDRGRRRGTLVLLVISVLVGVVLSLAPAAPASAQTPGSTTTTTQADDGDEGDEPLFTIRGSVIDRKGNRERDDDEPVEGARILVTNAAGEEIDEFETDEDGLFVIELDEPGVYTAVLDLDSLPEGVGAPPEGQEQILLDPNRSRVVVFNLGARERVVVGFTDRLMQRLVDGLNFGLLIAIMAIGLSLIFGTTSLVNFAHGELVVFGALAAWYLNIDGNLWIVWAALIAMVLGGLFGAATDRLLWRPLRHRGVSLFAMMVVSIGLGFFLRNLFLYRFGGEARSYGDYFAQRAVDLGPVSVAPKTLWSMGICISLLIGIALLLQYTRIGKAMRAVADNPDLASSSGVDVDRVVQAVWLMGGALAALGGVLYGLDQQVNSRFGFELLLLMFAGITLGGLGTAYGALLGSFLVGLLVEVSTLWVPFELKNVGALAVLIGILLIRPQGLLGRAERVG